MTELQARKLLKEAGWTYRGACTCVARIHKYTHGLYLIKLFLSGKLCALYFKNQTIMYEPLDHLEKIIKRHQAETEIP